MKGKDMARLAHYLNAKLPLISKDVFHTIIIQWETQQKQYTIEDDINVELNTLTKSDEKDAEENIDKYGKFYMPCIENRDDKHE